MLNTPAVTQNHWRVLHVRCSEQTKALKIYYVYTTASQGNASYAMRGQNGAIVEKKCTVLSITLAWHQEKGLIRWRFNC